VSNNAFTESDGSVPGKTLSVYDFAKRSPTELPNWRKLQLQSSDRAGKNIVNNLWIPDQNRSPSGMRIF